ncbi:GNAT family N-acetyltransferase [Mesorhizobium australicum]|uniref:Protein N-acetyltransferase, RimJ/RimL family n=1 Tax=Mesorhizobium australicum TaxID=536018 RepID=A0A1X7NTD9_9HYPH|nr:GNAT family N-acetyltransferase [Mesorhizobium australicum]SMH40506.1 Protein N-acetyltransferase, RimJ/RimL family [Mesorhizobium australicum]
MAVSLRPISLDDQTLVAGITVDPDTESYSGGPISDVFDQLRASPPRQHAFAVVDGDRVVGFIVAREEAALPAWAEKGCMTLNNLRIDRHLQGRGYGKAAIRLAAQWIARERPAITHVMSSVNVDNLAALHLNLACGLTPTGQIVEGRFGRQRIMIAPIQRLCIDQQGSTSTRSL